MLKRIATVAGTVAATTMLTITTASATDGNQLATVTTAPGTAASGCADSAAALVCFYPDGDWFGVNDVDKDGHSAVLGWNLIKSDTGAAVRWGAVWNTAGAYTVRYLNKDFPETGHYLELYACAGEWGTKTVIRSSCSPVHIAYV